jgi:hypothetical protein
MYENCCINWNTIYNFIIKDDVTTYMRSSTKETNPNKALVQLITRLWSQISYNFRQEPYVSDGTCQAFRVKMKQVYDRVLLHSKSSGGQYNIDFEMTNQDVTRPLIRQACALWIKIPDKIRIGSGFVNAMTLMSVSETNLKL